MNNIYVDEQPESCLDCEFCIKRNYCCILMQKDVREYRDDCPLISLSYRLAEERKRVVQEIRHNAISHNNLEVDMYYISPEQLDQIERGE